MPLATLAMPVRNGEQFIADAIDSTLAQDFGDFELSVTANCSEDGTEAHCRQYTRKDERVRYHRNAKNLGAAPNFNRGFELARGQYFRWCAHDDRISIN
jgi:glycosyltransferase involved in cell wall biosynthesis